MKTSMIVFGIIFLVIGALTYYIPMQEVSGGATVDGSTTNTSANLIVPLGWSYAFLAIGGLLLLFGLIIPSGATKNVPGPRGPRGRATYRRRPVRRYARRYPRTYRRASLPRGTSITTTVRTKR